MNQTRFWISAWSKRMQCACGCKGRCTFAAVWEVVNWSFNALAAQRWPRVRPDGQPFSESKRPGDKRRAKLAASGKKLKVRVAPCQFRGDWSLMKCTLNMIGWAPSGEDLRVCWKCLADCALYPFTQCGMDALWRSTLITHQIYLQMCMTRNIWVSELFGLPGFRLEYVDADLMHCSDLGIVQYLLGNIIFELCFSKDEMGSTLKSPQQAFADLMVMFRLGCKFVVPRLDKCPIGGTFIHHF